MCARLEELGSQFLAMTGHARIVRPHGLENLEITGPLGLVGLHVRQQLGELGVERVIDDERLFFDRFVGRRHEQG